MPTAVAPASRNSMAAAALAIPHLVDLMDLEQRDGLDGRPGEPPLPIPEDRTARLDIAGSLPHVTPPPLRQLGFPGAGRDD